MVKIAPSILSADFSVLAEQIKIVESAGADWLHLDIMDGHFVPNITFGPFIINSIRKLCSLPLDAHLMITDADQYIPAFKNAGVDHITVHYETCNHLWRTIESIKALGIKAGVTLNPGTPVQLLAPVLQLVDIVLVMTVEPGFSGQKFIPAMVEKIEWLYKYKNEYHLNYDIEVDGGIDVKTAPVVVRAGANVLVAGSAIYNNADIANALNELKNSARINL